MSELEAASTSSAVKKEIVKLEITEKIRVLCLHGYRQNGDAFKSKLGSFRKQVGKYAEFVFVTAPHQAPALEEGAESVPEQRSWWFNKEDRTFKGTNKSGPAFGFEQSLRLVEEAWKTQGPFQGLMGFSQGACFVGLICGFAEKHMTVINPDFVILASGFRSGSLVHLNAYEEAVSIPSLHIYGQTDDIIPAEMSKKLLANFTQAEILEHSGGHYFPATAQQKQTYINYFQDRLQDYLEKLELQDGQSTEFLDPEESAEEGSSSGDKSL